jgi:stage IV sporulation protein FB
MGTSGEIAPTRIGRATFARGARYNHITVNFRIGKIPVRIHASFLLMSVFLSGSWNDPSRIMVWAGVVLVSVMIHEMGHALMGQSFGLEPSIDLHGMGGTTSWPNGRAKISRWQSILISVAGPAAGLAVGAAVFFYFAYHPPLKGSLADTAVGDAELVNVGWGIVNLLPILPLDGGNVLRSLLGASGTGRREKIARLVSIVTAVLATAAAVLFFGSWWAALLGGMFTFQNFRALREVQSLEQDDGLRADLDAAYSALEREDGALVLAHAEPVLARAKSAPFRAEAIHLAAYGYLLTGRLADADRVIAQLPSGYKAHPSFGELRARYQANEAR